MSTEKKVTITTDDPIKEELGLDDYVRIETEPETEGNAAESEEEVRQVEDLDDDVVIWDGGPTAGQIKEWKKHYGDVYVTSLSYDKHVVWRTLNRLEYKDLVRKMEQLVQGGQLSTAEANLWNEEAITEICILFPQYDKRAIGSDMAGLPSLLSQEILEASGFVALEVRQL